MHQKLFFLLVLLLPVQFGRHFWPDFSLVFGIRVDYLAPTVYLTDLLVIAVLGTWAWEERKKIVSLRLNNKPFLIFLFSIFYLLFTSLFIAQNQGAALYKWIKIIEFFLLGFYVFKNWKLGTDSPPAEKLKTALAVAIIYSSLIAWGQFLLGSSIGGPFWWLGERTFDVSTTGIALATIFGQELLRPYSVFPHPNALAGFLLVSLVLIGFFRQTNLTKIATVVGAATILISFSRLAWIAGLTVLIFTLLEKRQKLLMSNFIFGAVFVASLIFPFLPVPFSATEKIVFRQELAKASGEMISQNPLFGVGPNNFISRLAEFSDAPKISWSLQPVHNIFLLAASETGTIGLLLLSYLFFKIFKNATKSNNLQLLTAILVILISGVGDHYWLTLQQNQLLLTTVFSLAAKGIKSS